MVSPTAKQAAIVVKINRIKTLPHLKFPNGLSNIHLLPMAYQDLNELLSAYFSKLMANFPLVFFLNRLGCPLWTSGGLLLALGFMPIIPSTQKALYSRSLGSWFLLNSGYVKICPTPNLLHQSQNTPLPHFIASV